MDSITMTESPSTLPDQKKPNTLFKYEKQVGDEKSEEKQIFMSYALLNRLTRACPNIEQLAGISGYPEVQDNIIANLLAPVKNGKPSLKDFDMETDTAGIDPEVIQDMLLWGVAHITSFFIGLANKNLPAADVIRNQVKGLTEKVKNQIDSVDGLKSSDSPTLSAGASDASLPSSIPSTGNAP